MFKKRMSSNKRIPSRRDDGVWMETGYLTWIRLTPSIKTVLLEGLERVAGVRADLGNSCKVAFLPPIQIKCELWNRECISFINGRVSPVPYNGMFLYGVELPAHVCACHDLGLLRALLVHEFLHVFHDVEFVCHRVRGAHRPTQIIDLGDQDPFSAEDDNARLAKPEHWFCDPTDWELLRHGHDARMQEGFASGYLLLAPHLRQSMPDLQFKHRNMGVATEWLEHAGKLHLG